MYCGGMEGSEGESRVVIFIRLNISSYCGGNAVETRWKRGGNAVEMRRNIVCIAGEWRVAKGGEGESRAVIFIRLNISSYCGGT